MNINDIFFGNLTNKGNAKIIKHYISADFKILILN